MTELQLFESSSGRAMGSQCEVCADPKDPQEDDRDHDAGKRIQCLRVYAVVRFVAMKIRNMPIFFIIRGHPPPPPPPPILLPRRTPDVAVAPSPQAMQEASKAGASDPLRTGRDILC